MVRGTLVTVRGEACIGGVIAEFVSARWFLERHRSTCAFRVRGAFFLSFFVMLRVLSRIYTYMWWIFMGSIENCMVWTLAEDSLTFERDGDR